MYNKIKLVIFTLIYLLLWARFIVVIADPTVGGGAYSEGLPFFHQKQWQDVLGYLYQYSNYLVNPLWNLYQYAGQPWKNQWFPMLMSADLVQWATAWATKNQQIPLVPLLLKDLQSQGVQLTFQGGFEWFTLVAILITRIVRTGIDYVYDFVKNLIWNVFIEMSFSKKKQAAYQQKLEQRAKDLMKLKVEYRNLSKEASQLSEAVVTDELTKVFNKRFFIEKVKYEFETAKNQRIYLSLVMMDIDHFKKLNDTHGHMMGDVVLKAVAHTLKRHSPKSGFCCRFGGEEFSLILPGFTQEQALVVLEPMRAEVEALTFKEKADLRTSISMGVITANFSHPDAQALATFEDFVKLADDELYRAKLGGRNRINCNQIVK